MRISLDDRDVPSYTQSLEHLERYCARPAFALERLSVIGGGDDQPERILYALPRHKRSQWVGSGRNQKAPAPDAQGVVNVSPHEFLDRLEGRPERSRSRSSEIGYALKSISRRHHVAKVLLPVLSFGPARHANRSCTTTSERAS